jgi:hypothetical protein
MLFNHKLRRPAAELEQGERGAGLFDELFTGV